MDHDEMIRRFHTDPATLSPKTREQVDAANAHTASLTEQGRYSSRKPDDNAAIGLDDSYNPFPVTNPVTGQERSDQD